MKTTRPVFSLKTRLSWLFFITSFAFYTLMTYGGIREPDSEVVYRTAESLADKGTFAVSRDLETWRGFGLQKGTDGRKYSCYSPGEEIMLVPLIKIAQSVNKSRWYNKYRESIPISHYVGNGVHQFLLGVPPQDIEPHALRFLVSFFNILVCSVSAVLFLRLLEKLTHSLISAGFVTVLFAFGTLMLPYSGTLFSEPLA
ncbi:hypothetical protein HZA73_02685, partial [candidate division TA06 bacterium]|nr:hypothetical protein [candidate division TA06 bacterium]